MSGEKTIFKKIIDREIPADIIYEDELCLAFNDVNPQAPVHVLVIPKQEIQSIAHLQDSDQALAGHNDVHNSSLQSMELRILIANSSRHSS